MASIIRSIRRLRGAGVLANRTAQSPNLGFLRYNLIYGFNGSGKSTLSRIIASLQQGSRSDRLPSDCEFEIEMDDGSKYVCPEAMTGLESRVLVFNADFVEKNLQWSVGRANPVFYIGREQTERASELAKLEASLPKIQEQANATADLAKAKGKTLANFRRDLARAVAERLQLRGRRYEAPQLEGDYAELSLSDTDILPATELESLTAANHLSEPPQAINTITVQDLQLSTLVNEALTLLASTPNTGALTELQKHPSLLSWVHQGHDHHTRENLKTCVFCGSEITPARFEQLEQAFDKRLEAFLQSINDHERRFRTIETTLNRMSSTLPAPERLWPDLRARYETFMKRASEAIAQVAHLVSDIAQKLQQKNQALTESINLGRRWLPSEGISLEGALTKTIEELNEILSTHNRRINDFHSHQRETQQRIKKHYLAEGKAEYDELSAENRSATNKAEAAAEELESTKNRITELRSSIRKHGPAAETINKLIHAYLGHRELTISAVDDGYEIHRHGQLLKTSPSEGEKTAIALCYFISTIESDGRALRDLIVVIDDPISSLDTKAMNFACAMIRNRLQGAAQLFVLTHNQHCMNEFKKTWKSMHRPRNEPARAAFLFLDVTMPKGQSFRSTNVVEMSKFLREYDFEYHYLFHHIIKFEQSGMDYEYAYLMPNVLRRVLDVFLAFRCPGSSSLLDKLRKLGTSYPNLNQDRISALERLSQVESHSDNLDDLIAFSSMTIEECKDANGALLDLMTMVDEPHVRALRDLCR